MELKTCQKCKRLFYYIRGECLCKDCMEKVDELFEKATEYLTEHERARMMQISQECDIPAGQVKTWIKEERIHTVDEQKVYSICEGCGSRIPSGQFCTSCKSRYITGIKNALVSDQRNSAQKKPVKDKSVQMRFLSSRKK